MCGVITRYLLKILLFLFLSAGAVAAQSEYGKPMQLAADKAPLIFLTKTGKQDFTVEIAKTAEEKERGLMYRRLFPENRAMLFVFDRQQMAVMWMEHTSLPLDMVFADKEGRIVSVYEKAKPFSRRLIYSQKPVSYVVELNAGTVGKIGIKEGEFIRHPIICGECGG